MFKRTLDFTPSYVAHIANSVDCQVVCVPARLVDKALQEGEKNTHRHEVNGKIALVTERRTVDQVGGN